MSVFDPRPSKILSEYFYTGQKLATRCEERFRYGQYEKLAMEVNTLDAHKYLILHGIPS